MARCVLVVTFHVKPGQRDAFTTIMSEHAARTKAEEPGCHQFDVLHPDDEPDTVMLVEAYEDHAALAAHRAGGRMPAVGAAIEPLLTGRTVTVCTRV